MSVGWLGLVESLEEQASGLIDHIVEEQVLVQVDHIVAALNKASALSDMADTLGSWHSFLHCSKQPN